MRSLSPLRLTVLLLLAAACNDPAPAAPIEDAGADLLPVDKAARCASTFGAALTAGFGRLDGTVLAVVPPAHPTCARPNDDHLVLQVLAGGAAYRMVVNVMSTVAGQDPRVRLGEATAPLPGGAFSEGWHAGASFDYVQTLGVHATSFVPYDMDELVRRVTDRVALDARVSVFASTSGGDSAHLVHRNAPGLDGAIVLDPDGASPAYLLFAFADQVF